MKQKNYLTDDDVQRIGDASDEFGPASVLPFYYGGSNGLLTNEFEDARFFRRIGASRLARRSISVGGPLGSQPCSSARDHCTRTGRPTALAKSAASAAASSWPLRP